MNKGGNVISQKVYKKLGVILLLVMAVCFDDVLHNLTFSKTLKKCFLFLRSITSLQNKRKKYFVQ